MSIGVMLILGVAAIFVGWKVWKMIQGKNDGGCCGGSGSSCSPSWPIKITARWYGNSSTTTITSSARRHRRLARPTRKPWRPCCRVKPTGPAPSPKAWIKPWPQSNRTRSCASSAPCTSREKSGNTSGIDIVWNCDI